MKKTLTSLLLFISSFAVVAQDYKNDVFFLQKEMTPFSRTANDKLAYDQERIDEIKKAIYDLTKEEQNNNIDKNDPIFVQRTNEKWITENALDNYKWYDKFETSQLKYLGTIHGVNQQKSIIDKYEAERDALKNEIENLELKILRERDLKDQVTNYNVDIKSTLEKKLETIPVSGVIIARTPRDVFSSEIPLDTIKTKIKKITENVLLDVAVAKYAKAEMLNIAIEDQDKFSFLQKIVKSGVASIENYYYKQLFLKAEDNSGKSKRYYNTLTRVEILPSRKEKNKSDSENMVENASLYENVEVFLYDKENTTLTRIENNEGVITPVEGYIPLGKLKFREEEQKYLNFLTSFSDNLNKKYKESREFAMGSYKAQMEQNEKKEKKIQEGIDSLYKVLNDKKKELIEKKEFLEAKTSYNKAIADFEIAKKEYEQKYLENKTIVNRLMFKKQTTNDIMDDTEFLQSMVSDVYQVALDVTKKRVEYEVYRDKNVEGIIKPEKNDAIKKPRVTSYQILSMNISEDGEQEYDFALNVAFELTWTTTLEKTYEFIEFNEGGVSGIYSNDFDKPKYYFSEYESSFTMAYSDIESGELLTIEELNSVIRSCATQYERKKLLDSFFQSAATDEIYFISKTTDKDFNYRPLVKALKVNGRNNYDYTEELIPYGTAAYIIYKK